MKSAKNVIESVTIKGNELVLRLPREQAELLAECMAGNIDGIADPNDRELQRCLEAMDLPGIVRWWRAGGRQRSFDANNVHPENRALFDLDVLILEALAAKLQPKQPKRRAA